MTTCNATPAQGLTRRQAISTIGGLALASAALSTPLLQRRAWADGRDTLRMAIAVDPDGLDPQRTAAAATFQITNNVYDPLLKVSTSGELLPGLAEEWEVSKDGLTLTFTLRDGVVFSNGNPCDADAVKASFERLQAQDSPRNSEYAGYTFEAPDATTLVVTSESLNVAALTDFAYAWSAVVDVTAADDLRSHPVGTGPYTVESWTPQQEVVLKANPSYWGEAPLLENVVLKVIPKATTQVGTLRTGDVDLILADSSQVAPFENDPSFQIIADPMNGVQLMAMNCANEALADQRVRQAIVMAVNRQQVIDMVWWGYGEAIGSHYPTVFQGYVDCTQTIPYDPDKARSLLAEAGYGTGLSLWMRLPKDYPFYVDAGQVIAGELAKVGVTCNIEIIEWGDWLQEVYMDHKYDLTVVGHTGRLDPITLLARYRSDNSENYFNFSSETVDALIDEYRGELDEARRLEIVGELQEELAREAPALYIQTPVMTYVATPEVRGFEQYPIDIYEFSKVSLG